MFSFDDVIDSICGSEKYQFFLIAGVMCYAIPGSFVVTAPVFLAAVPDSRCRVEPYDNKSLYPNITDDVIKQVFMPWNSVTQRYDRCKMNVYNVTQDGPLRNIDSVINKTAVNTVACEDGYVYDHSIFIETIITEWDVVCDKAFFASLSSASFYAGVFLGSVMGGVLSDRFGRVFIFRGAIVFSIIFGCATAFSPNMTLFTIFRFLLAVSFFQATVGGFTYVAEISKKSWRIPVGLEFNGVFGLGCIIFSGLAYIWRDWRDLQLAMTLIGFVPLLIFSWFLPKSPRWLCGQGKLQEAKVILEIMAKRNGTALSEDVWRKVEKHYGTERKQVNSDGKDDAAVMKRKTIHPSKIFQQPYTRYMICSNMFVWMVTCLVYYGLVLSGGSLPGSIFVNNALGGLMEILALSIAIPSIFFIGFTKTTFISLFVASFSCLISTLVVQLSYGNTALQSFAIVLAMFGRFGSSMTFGTIFLHTVEMFPTVARSTAFGLSSMAARAGSIFSPFTVQLQQNIPWLSPVIYGTTAFFAGLVASTFPDTSRKQLTTTFDEAEVMFYHHLKGSVPSKIFCLPRSINIDDEETEEILSNEKSSA